MTTDVTGDSSATAPPNVVIRPSAPSRASFAPSLARLLRAPPTLPSGGSEITLARTKSLARRGSFNPAPPLASFDARTAVVDRLPAASAPTRPKPPNALAAACIAAVHPSTRPLVRRPRAPRARHPSHAPPLASTARLDVVHASPRTRTRARRAAAGASARLHRASRPRARLSPRFDRAARALARYTDRPAHRRRARSSSPPRARRRLPPRETTARIAMTCTPPLPLSHDPTRTRDASHVHTRRRVEGSTRARVECPSARARPRGAST